MIPSWFRDKQDAAARAAIEKQAQRAKTQSDPESFFSNAPAVESPPTESGPKYASSTKAIKSATTPDDLLNITRRERAEEEKKLKTGVSAGTADGSAQNPTDLTAPREFKKLPKVHTEVRTVPIRRGKCGRGRRADKGSIGIPLAGSKYPPSG
jgi:hypothetical protein